MAFTLFRMFCQYVCDVGAPGKTHDIPMMAISPVGFCGDVGFTP